MDRMHRMESKDEGRRLRDEEHAIQDERFNDE
jgi:hypothetical protein